MGLGQAIGGGFAGGQGGPLGQWAERWGVPAAPQAYADAVSAHNPGAVWHTDETQSSSLTDAVGGVQLTTGGPISPSATGAWAGSRSMLFAGGVLDAPAHFNGARSSVMRWSVSPGCAK